MGFERSVRYDAIVDFVQIVWFVQPCLYFWNLLFGGENVKFFALYSEYIVVFEGLYEPPENIVALRHACGICFSEVYIKADEIILLAAISQRLRKTVESIFVQIAAAVGIVILKRKGADICAAELFVYLVKHSVSLLAGIIVRQGSQG